MHTPLPRCLTFNLACCSEVIDAMYLPSKYDSVYPFSYMFTYFVTVPHALLTQLAFPVGNSQQGVPQLLYTVPGECMVIVFEDLRLPYYLNHGLLHDS